MPRPIACSIGRGASRGFCSFAAAAGRGSRPRKSAYPKKQNDNHERVSRTETPGRDLPMLDQALTALRTFDWGDDPELLRSIDEEVVACHGDEARRAALEQKLLAALERDLSRDAVDYVCRHLGRIGSAVSVPVLAAMLSDEQKSHMARFALEQIPVSEAVAALRAALPKLTGSLQVGVIGSLGTRADAASVSALAALLRSDDEAIARAAASALGNIRTASAAQALTRTDANPAAESSVAAAMLACAEGLLAAGENAKARELYTHLSGAKRAKHVQLAALRGRLMCDGNRSVKTAAAR
ncbi:MAG: hypothetical protein DWQ35_11195 [Planctomycetota bacterium]|nr:MAG: hypothetical protein DWQ35_11195 [Planctomycetota bacterium]